MLCICGYSSLRITSGSLAFRPTSVCSVGWAHGVRKDAFSTSHPLSIATTTTTTTTLRTTTMRPMSSVQDLCPFRLYLSLYSQICTSNEESVKRKRVKTTLPLSPSTFSSHRIPFTFRLCGVTDGICGGRKWKPLDRNRKTRSRLVNLRWIAKIAPKREVTIVVSVSRHSCEWRNV